MRVGELRKKYPTFVYRGYEYKVKAGDLHISFVFEVGDITFQPKTIIRRVSNVSNLVTHGLENLVFHLGLAEMPSYWKATASPKILVEAGPLNKTQLYWWHDLFLKGMGQYFYENHIDFTKSHFLEIKASHNSRIRKNYKTGLRAPSASPANKIVVPIGGGKDAIVTYEVLKQAGEKIQPLVLNPTRAQKALLKKMGERAIVVERTIDPKLLELNRKGYLNGHTPFSAYLAFLATLCAVLFDRKHIALSNERSSNEGNVRYLDQEINHQYSKSWEFEKKFRSYSKKYLTKDVEYFSFLRPLYELQIAKLFSRYQKYFATFLSCNEAHKTNSGSTKLTGNGSTSSPQGWCGACAKCLFVFAVLYPFVETKRLEEIFGKNLFQDPALIPLMEELIGERNFKPFECVGTAKEALAAFYLCLQKAHAPLPALLQHFRWHAAKKHEGLPRETKALLRSWNGQHALPPPLEKTLRSVLE